MKHVETTETKIGKPKKGTHPTSIYRFLSKACELSVVYCAMLLLPEEISQVILIYVLVPVFLHIRVIICVSGGYPDLLVGFSRISPAFPSACTGIREDKPHQEPIGKKDIV